MERASKEVERLNNVLTRVQKDNEQLKISLR